MYKPDTKIAIFADIGKLSKVLHLEFSRIIYFFRNFVLTTDYTYPRREYRLRIR
jgi:hypothetical protein